jgi:protein-disulfide isomerase
MHLATFGVVTLAGAYGFQLYHQAKEDAQSGGVASRIVDEFYTLPVVEWPSFISPYMTAKATEDFEDAPIRIVEYVDLLCPDCLYLNRQLDQLKEEFAGKINIAIQLFPLEAKCNDVVPKDLHEGACDVSYMAAHDPDKFLAIHDEIFANFRDARTPEWRAELARRYDVEDALTDSTTIAMVDRLIQTGAEYERTSERFEHGIRSTPTMIINNRMIIGTFPLEQLRAIFQALVDDHERGEDRFLENWVG